MLYPHDFAFHANLLHFLIWFTSIRSPGNPPARGWLADLGEGGGERLEYRRVERRPQGDDGEPQPFLSQRSSRCDGGSHVSVVYHGARQENLARISTQVAAVGMQDVPLLGEFLWGPAEEAPMLSEAGRRAEGALFSVTPDADGRVGALDALGFVAGVGKLVVLAPEGGRLPAHEASEHLTGLLEPVAALRGRTERNAVGTRFLFVPTGSYP